MGSFFLVVHSCGLKLCIYLFIFIFFRWVFFSWILVGATWCVCKEGLSDSTLQKSLDYACGAGADCGPIHLNGQCYNPNTVKAHCSYAVNSYFQKKGQAQGTCDFAGTASISTSDPSKLSQSPPPSLPSTFFQIYDIRELVLYSSTICFFLVICRRFWLCLSFKHQVCI